MPQPTAERLDRLEQENAALKAEVDRLKGKVEPPPKPASPPIIWDGSIGRPLGNEVAMVRTIPEPPPPELTWENVRELRRIVGLFHPQLIVLSNRATEDETILRFGDALLTVEMMYGATDEDRNHDLAWYAEYARNEILREKPVKITDKEFLCAVLAHGVYFKDQLKDKIIKLHMAPYSTFGTSRTIWPLRGRWRDVLKRGRVYDVPEPVADIRNHGRVGLVPGPTQAPGGEWNPYSHSIGSTID